MGMLVGIQVHAVLVGPVVHSGHFGVGSNVHEQLKFLHTNSIQKVLRKGPRDFPTQQCVEFLVVQQRMKEIKGHVTDLPCHLH
jgi:hypothetical protein